jgi:large subunit ribosomal protein L12
MKPLVRLVHWNEEEARERAARLKALGFTAVWRVLPGPDLLAELKTTKAVAIVVDLTRLPSHGRDVGLHVRRTKATRHLPLVFVGGEPEKVARVKALLASLEGVNLTEVLAKAETFAAPAAAAAPSEKKEGKGEKKEEEKKEEKGVSEEEAAEGLSALFG